MTTAPVTQQTGRTMDKEGEGEVYGLKIRLCRFRTHALVLAYLSGAGQVPDCHSSHLQGPKLHRWSGQSPNSIKAARCCRVG